jgi:hypothetical protein
MLLAQRGVRKIEELVVETLHKSGASGPTLLAEIKENEPGISKETFYRVLRNLLNEEVLNKQSKIYQLNRHWLQRVYRFSKKQIETNKSTDSDNILSFEEGDKISYKFKNPNLMGIYWAHTYDMIFEKHDSKTPILIYHPHEWLIHTRVESESFFLSRFSDDKKLVFFSIGGNTELDKQFKSKWTSKFIQIGTGINYGLKKTEYINVLGDFIFKVSVSRRFSEDIDVFFRKYGEINLENHLELEKLCNRKDSTKMVFTRSKKEADKWRIKFKKHFYIPKSL